MWKLLLPTTKEIGFEQHLRVDSDNHRAVKLPNKMKQTKSISSSFLSHRSLIRGKTKRV